MNKKTVEYVQRTVDDALTRLFYDAKLNDFDKPHYSSVYLCTYKNKLVVLLSKSEFRNHFQSCIELHCPGLTDKSMKFHLENILKKIPRAAKEQISYKMSKFKFCSNEHATRWLYQYVTRNFALKCQDYFDNFLTEYLIKVKHSKEYQQIVDIIARKIQLSEDYADELETCSLIGDVIRSLGLDLTFEEVDEITEAIYCSNVLENARFKS